MKNGIEEKKEFESLGIEKVELNFNEIQLILSSLVSYISDLKSNINCYSNFNEDNEELKEKKKNLLNDKIKEKENYEKLFNKFSKASLKI